MDIVGSENADSLAVSAPSTVDSSPKIGSQPSFDSPASVGDAGSVECVDSTPADSSPAVAAPKARPQRKGPGKGAGSKATKKATKTGTPTTRKRRCYATRVNGNLERTFAPHYPPSIHAIYMEDTDESPKKKNSKRKGKRAVVTTAVKDAKNHKQRVDRHKEEAAKSAKFHCVPLWPMHLLSNPLMDLPDDAGRKTWWIMSPKEEWVIQIAKLSGPLPQKTFHKAVATVAQQLKDAIQEARKAVVTDYRERRSIAEDDDGKGVGLWMMQKHASFEEAPLLRLIVQGHNLVALNCQRLLAIEANEAARDYIQKVIVPLFISEARAPSTSVATPPEEAHVETGFGFNSDVLNVRGKVAWNPHLCSYKLELKGTGSTKQNPSTDIEGNALAIPSDKRPTKEERRKLFKRACEAWNEKDTSGRPRIA